VKEEPLASRGEQTVATQTQRDVNDAHLGRTQKRL
jgi:hypothetical protein